MRRGIIATGIATNRALALSMPSDATKHVVNMSVPTPHLLLSDFSI